MESDYGRNRRSIANFEERLNDLIASLPDATTKPDGTIVVPSIRLQEVLDHFKDDDGMPILSEDQQATLLDIISVDPSLEISATMLMPLAVLAEQKREEAHQTERYDDDDDFTRGRRMPGSPGDDDQEYAGRSSSNDSTGTRRNSSRPPSRGHGSVPHTPRAPSAFDSSRRQRATPLSNNPPSSYAKRPAAPSRRKSDAGSRSDSESYSTSPSAYGYRNAAPRTRAPSNPTSPRLDDFSDILGSPPPTFRPPSRPSSRNQGLHFGGSPTNERGYSSPDDTILSPSGFAHSISSLPMPRHHDDDSDSDEDESALGLVMERQTTASTVSMEPFDRVDVLQRANDELRKKLVEAESTLQKRLEEHEGELEDLTLKIDELTTELHATKKEEKELRSKERTNSNQISTLENEIGKLNRQLDHARTTYQSLQRQYQEQCTASEKYRDDLRRRDEAIRTLTDAASMHESEQTKWNRERDSYEDRIERLEEELLTAQTAHASLDEQKQENLMLKETIDRLRFDMDELRNSYSSNVGGAGGGLGSGASSRNNTVSKSLGAELAGKLGWDEGNSEETEDADDEGEEGGSETVVEDVLDSSDGEDVIQTIIRRRRKVPSKANRVETSQTIEENKEYSDSSTQYDPDMFMVGSFTQTDPEPLPPPRVIMAVQTDPLPTRHSVEIGTDPVEEDERVLVEVEIQTELELEVSTSAATSGTTTPKSTTIPLPSDSPPTYNQVAYEREIQSRVAAELRKLHPGNERFVERVVNEGLLEEWQAFKDELGLDCGVIDEALEKAKVIPRRRDEAEGGGGKKRASLGGRFYRNIYNTYVYGSPEGRASAPSSSSQGGPSPTSALITQGAMIAGASALVIGASALVQMAFANSGFGPQYNLGVAGGPTYHDRVAWAGFNAMPGAAEGFAYYGGGYHAGGGGDAGAFWNFLGRATERAARAAAGWPT
ncbi:hypothetical protein E1B28_010841 [Marasmius oreades]|uniref:Uncharacterized protein n=1 Tax=Marasmius oreades TaxID=181124 RepID=A0A9P7UPD1_9AGAR|nr:uncharacterized protein E1B28_010841 [Marasmius oreades]KAG7089133.1 hypothetical protein E1B28_010841 [Marasmius oreades]